MKNLKLSDKILIIIAIAGILAVTILSFCDVASNF